MAGLHDTIDRPRSHNSIRELLNACVCCCLPFGTGLPVWQRCKSTGFLLLTQMALQSVSYACVEWRDCTTQSIGRDLTIAFESYLMHVCVVACPLAQGYLYGNGAKALDFSYSHKWLSNPYRMLVLNGGIARHNR